MWATFTSGTWSEFINITQDEEGMKKLFTQFSFPGGISMYVAPTAPVPFMKAASWVTRLVM